MAREIYLDNNATTRPLPEVRAAMLSALDEDFGNPSSVHTAGDRARDQLRAARESLAALIGADPDRLFFTSGGTEANNAVLLNAALPSTPANGRRRIVTSAVEHSSILNLCEPLAARGVELVALPVDGDGRLDLDRLEDTLAPGADLVSIQWVNNETGVVQPIREIAALCRSRGVPFHTDAAQAVGKLPVNLAELPVDFLSLTGHKFHGPQGIGALYIDRPKAFSPLMFGGPQEGGMRAGTENMPSIVGLGKAAELRLARRGEIIARLARLRDRFEEAVLSRIGDVVVNGGAQPRVSNTSNLRFAGVDGQALVARLDQQGIRCSQSSACTNQRPEPSYVLKAMGLSEDEAYASVRFSFSELNTQGEIEQAVETIAAICQQLRRFSQPRPAQEPLAHVTEVP